MNNELQPMVPNQSLQRQLDAKSILAVVIRRKWIIMLVALPVIIVAIIGALRSEDVVTANARVMLEAKQVDNLAFDRITINYDILMSSSAQVAVSIPVSSRAAVALIDSLPRFCATNPGLAEVHTVEELRDVLLGGVDCAQVGESTILKIMFRHPDPEFCLLAVGALTEAFIAFSIESHQSPRAVGFYNDQIEAVQTEIDKLMTDRVTVLRETGYGAFETGGQASVDQQKSIEEEYVHVRSQRAGFETNLNGLKTLVELDPDFVPLAQAGGDGALSTLRYELDTLRAELERLRVQYQEDSVWVQRQKTLVTEAQQKLHKQRDLYMKELGLELESLRSTEAELRDAVESRLARIQAYPEINRQIESLDLQIKAKYDLLEVLQIKRGEARLKSMADNRISGIIALDEPTIDSWGSGSKKFLYLFLLGGFAVVLGFLIALFIDNQDHRLVDQHKAEQYLQVPVLGAISPPQSKDRAS